MIAGRRRVAVIAREEQDERVGRNKVPGLVVSHPHRVHEAQVEGRYREAHHDRVAALPLASASVTPTTPKSSTHQYNSVIETLKTNSKRSRSAIGLENRL